MYILHELWVTSPFFETMFSSFYHAAAAGKIEQLWKPVGVNLKGKAHKGDVLGSKPKAEIVQDDLSVLVQLGCYSIRHSYRIEKRYAAPRVLLTLVYRFQFRVSLISPCHFIFSGFYFPALFCLLLKFLFTLSYLVCLFYEHISDFISNIIPDKASWRIVTCESL